MRALRWAPALLAVAPLWAQSRDDAPSADAITLTHFAVQQGDATPERVAAVLAHEGSHVADARVGGQPTAAAELRARQSELVTAATELEARKAELEACSRLFGPGVQPNRGCADAAALLATDDAGALARLKEAGYR